MNYEIQSIIVPTVQTMNTTMLNDTVGYYSWNYGGVSHSYGPAGHKNLTFNMAYNWNQLKNWSIPEMPDAPKGSMYFYYGVRSNFADYIRQANTHTYIDMLIFGHD